MCGIAGCVAPAGAVAVQDCLAVMAEAIVHRGPDDHGYFRTVSNDGNYVIGLAHRRLSIIDLSTGHQPLANEDGAVSIVFNGEIYNFESVRAELTAFRSWRLQWFVSLLDPGPQTYLAGHRLEWSEPAVIARSRDGTVKVAFRLEDGPAIESVLIPTAGRATLCVSTQAGCAMGCRYCLTGASGFGRDLTAAEIVNQVDAVRELLLAEGSGGRSRRQPIDNLVFMGMGEALANYGNLIEALAVLGDERGPAFSERRLTVSTCGLAARIRDLGRDARVNLAVSLHTVDDEVRSDLMPVNRSCGVDELLAACREFAGSGRRVVFFECVLLAGVNDADEDARRLAEG